MMKKAAIELSMNMLVMLVIAFVAFGFSINFIYNIYGKAKGLQSRTFEDLDKQIGYLRCGTEQVCIGDKSKTIRRANFDVFGIRILNVLDQQIKFKVFVRQSGLNSEVDENYNQPGHKINLLPSEITEENPDCGTSARCETIDPNSAKTFALGVEVGKATKSGTYVFDVFVKYEKCDVADPNCNNFEPYGEAPKYKLNVIVT